MLKQTTKLVVPLLLVTLILTFLLPRNARWGYDYSKGSAWKYETLLAQFDFPILKTEEQIREEMSRGDKGVVPYYKSSAEVVASALKDAERLDLGTCDSLKGAIVRTVRSIYDKGVAADLAGVAGDNSGEGIIYIQKDKRAAKYPASEVFSVADARARMLMALTAEAPGLNADSLLRAAGVYDLIAPNLIFDPQTTALVHAENQGSVSPTAGYVKAGQLIVSAGEIVTPEIEQMLDSYRHEYEEVVGYSGPRWLLWTSNAVLALALVLILFFAILFSNPKAVYRHYNCYLYLITVFVIAAVAALLVGTAGPKYLLLVPFSLTALYLQAFFKNKVIFPVYVVSLIPLLIISEYGVPLFIMYIAAGSVALYAFKAFSKGVKQFILAFITFGVLGIVYTAFWFLGLVSGSLLENLILLFAGSMLTVAGYPLIYLFERIFNLVSNSRLQEVADSSSELLHELEQNAPGTFQHSLQVMNMSRSCARLIGANEFLVRAGALYHDIGKINNPLCFVENESLTSTEEGTKYHAGLTPLQSAQDIIRHVTDGMEIAEKHRLPVLVSEFILTHHGTSCVSYFYNKFVNEGGDPAMRSEFCYPGRKPQSTEQLLVMICDSIEAASRTLGNYSSESISALVENIIAGKIEEGQFSEAEMSVKELEMVKAHLKDYLSHLYHERIKYPKRNKSN